MNSQELKRALVSCVLSLAIHLTAIFFVLQTIRTPLPVVMPGPIRINLAEFERQPADKGDAVESESRLPALPDAREQRPRQSVSNRDPAEKPKPSGRMSDTPAEVIPPTDMRQQTDGARTSQAVSAEKIPPAYEQEILSLLARNKEYPRAAVRQGIQGEVLLLLDLQKDGKLLRHEIIESSGSKLLDEEVHRMVARSVPFPPFPPDYPKDRTEFAVPIRFELR